MRRGDVAIIAQRGVYEGKPRPAIIIQAAPFLDEHPSILVCLIASAQGATIGEAPYRIPIHPTTSNGLRAPSIIMADKITTIRRANVAHIVGHIDQATLGRLNTGLVLFQGLA